MLAYQQSAAQPMKFALIFILSSLMACAAQAAGVTLSVSDRPSAPLTFPDHEGQAQYLARQAMRAAVEQAPALAK
jgi:hypothetical protein